MRNFLCGCLDPLYLKFGNKLPKNRPLKLQIFLESKEFKNDLKKSHGCVIFKDDIARELKLINKVKNKKLNLELKELYYKIRTKIKFNKRLTLIWKPNKSEIKEYNYVLLHEFIHELIESNNLRPKNWKWNEGLATYLTDFSYNQHKKHLKKLKSKSGSMYDTYLTYARKWAILFEEEKMPKKRFKIIKENT